MLTQLTTVKARLALDPFDTTYDALLTSAIVAISARFDRETHRALARAENVTCEFPADASQIVVPCYPIESVAKFELKLSESEGWIEVPDVEYLILQRCVICLNSPFRTPHFALSLGRVTYTGGYLLPGGSPVPSAASLPAELEQAALEQTAFWFQTRDKVGVIRQWPAGGNYEQFADPDLLPSVRAVLAGYTRFAL
jgi:hypothetical protein